MDKGNRLKQSDNIFRDILASKGNESVYFYRIIGCDDIQTFRAEVSNLDLKLRRLGSYIRFEQGIPLTTDPMLIDQMREMLKNVTLQEISTQPLSAIIRPRGYFDLIPRIQGDPNLANALDGMFDLYRQNERLVNLSIIINFISKILLWFAQYAKELGQGASPKLLYWGSPKVHEIYFLILMSQLGSDVLVLNTSLQDNFPKVDKLQQFCLVQKKDKESPIEAFPVPDLGGPSPGGPGPSSSAPAETMSHAGPIDLSANDRVIVTKLKKIQSLFDEFLVSLPNRGGFIGGPFPVLPVYFVRYIGVPQTSDDWEAEYLNSIFNLDQALQALGPYLKFIGGVPAPTVAESALIPQRITGYPYRTKQEILTRILAGGILKRTGNELLDNTLEQALVNTLNLFADRNPKANLSILLNFSLKLVSWLNRYLSQLFSKAKAPEHASPNMEYQYNPRVVFYGDIKPHEIYFLYLLHSTGCDVVFVHSHASGDQPWQSFDPYTELTSLLQSPYNLPLKDFPQAELPVRKSTVAYQASREIQEIIYSEEVGLFKPWQFESYLTQPITLKTTYDELKILWPEQAKIRPEFKVQNKKVYVPNVFAKVNGVCENIEDYWQDLKLLTSAPNSKIITTMPFCQPNYSRQELFQTAYLLNEAGLFDEQKVRKSQHYKFGYLKMPLQHFLIAKINELIQAGLFLEGVDEKVKLQVLMTILTMDDSLIKLLEIFDFPQEIPKIIVYDNQKEGLGLVDAIMLTYFNIVGFDIVIFTPTNYTTIEQYLKPGVFDVHQLPVVKFDLNLPNLASITNSTQKHGILARFLNLRS